MAGGLNLNGTWRLTWTEGTPLTPFEPWLETGDQPGRGWIDAVVPMPIHCILQEQGLLDDPNYGLNSLKARWVEEQFWVYRRSFDLPREALNKALWLRFDWLEYDADVFVNGRKVGHHANAFRPAVFRVDSQVHPGANDIAVLLTGGLHGTADKSAAEYDRSGIGKLVKRHWMRKAQYQCGWDWNARLMNVGILGDVRLEWADNVRIGQFGIDAEVSPDLGSARLTARIVVENLDTDSHEANFALRLQGTEVLSHRTVELPSGVSVQQISLVLDHPRLWWPRGFGDQALHTAELVMRCVGEEQRVTRRFGIRRITVDQTPAPGGGRHFILQLNNQPVFLRGANWVPPDSRPAAVPPERYRALVELAVAANFNCLRVWGGGTYANHVLCDACDEAGLVL